MLTPPVGDALSIGTAWEQRSRRPVRDPAPAERPPDRPRAGGASPVPHAGGADLRHPSAGFVAHLMVEDPVASRGFDPDRGSGLGAYRARLGMRISYSGPVRPVDIQI